ncbi:hypothetical protein OAQ99_03100 [Candidatus Kapabacteria bacterium]|nr:hypothetical protein [Candidatus Kapabacteria bacterium]
MYYISNIEIDPAQITKIKRIKNGNILNRLVDRLNVKNTQSKIETETFTVVSILDQIRGALVDLHLDNIIKLSINGFDYYYDKSEVENDLVDAIEALDSKIDPIESERFEDIHLILEHEDESLKYYVDIKILRKHKVGEYPIKIITNGLIREFHSPDMDEKALNSSISSHFNNQDEIDKYLSGLEAKFKIFVKALENNLATFINSDGVKSLIGKRILRPIIKGSNREIEFSKYADPIFQGYPGIQNHFLYLKYWIDFCKESKITCSDFILIDYKGNPSVCFENEQINANNSNLFDITQEISETDLRGLRIYEKGIYGAFTTDNLIREEDSSFAFQSYNYTNLNLE